MMTPMTTVPVSKRNFWIPINQINGEEAKRNGFVASAIARSHSCRLQPVQPSEGRGLEEKCKN